MRTATLILLVAGAGLLRGPSAGAQVVPPPTGSAGAQVVPPPTGLDGPTAAAPRPTLWGFLGLSHDNLAKCRAKFCASGIGQVVNGMLAPVSAFSGGVIGGLCPPGAAAGVTPADAAAPVTGPQGAQSAAAKVQAYQAEAKATIAAIAYLSTVDCHYWPEAEAALITALRANRVECVRLAAAQALAAGCCCTKETTEALRITVSGSEEDGNPSETSPRVRQVAFLALQRCLARPVPLSEDELEEERPPIEAPVPALGSTETVPSLVDDSPALAYYIQTLRDTRRREVVAKAWRTLASLGQATARDAARTPSPSREAGPRRPSLPESGVALNAVSTRPAGRPRSLLASEPPFDRSVQPVGGR